MNKPGQFKRRPGAGGQPNLGVDAFIANAGKPPTTFPWDGLDDEEPRSLYNLRFTEAKKAQMEYIVANTKFKSMQEFCMHYLEPAINEHIEKLTGEQEV